MSDATQTDGVDLVEMSDEDIMKMDTPPPVTAQETDPNAGQDTVSSGSGDDTVSGDNGATTVDTPKEETKEESKREEAKKDEENPLNASDEEFDKPKPKAEEKPKDEDKSKETTPAAKVEKPETQPEKPVDYKAAYEQIMAPFKASGRQMQVKSPEEAIALMQRGFDYTRKMQQLKPALKIMKMLENNGLMDEGKLSHFIDLDKKDPAAVAKFLKDKQIDPLDLDMSAETGYKPGNHTVSDEEMRFTTVLEDVQSTPFGRETVQIIDKQWDKTSQGRVFKEPKILELINTHRETGIYDQVTAEVERLKLLEVIPEDAVFLDAYKTVADELHKHGRLIVDGVPTNQKKQETPAPKAPTGQQQQPQTTRQIVETRAAKPKPAAVNGDAARAAATTRTTPAKAQTPQLNPLLMSDEEFEKQAGNFRL